MFWPEFLTAQSCSLIEIHTRLRSVYGEETEDVSAVRRWIYRFTSGEKNMGDRARSGRPATAAISGTVKRSFLWNSWHNQLTAICTDIREVNASNSKGSAKQEDESSTPAA
jgi:hypothetical protein